MILYLAGIGAFPKIHPYILENFSNIGVLCTFADIREFISLAKSGFKNIMADSGAYSVSKRGLTINLDEYISFLKENEDKITISVALDVIGDPQKSCDNWRYMQSKNIKNLMPTFHLGEDIKWLDLYCAESEFVGIGGIANSVTNWKLYDRFLKRIINKYPNHKFHAFGLNSHRALRTVDLYSCDATTWQIGMRFAELPSDNGRIHLRSEDEKSNIWLELKKFGIEYSDFVANTHDYNMLALFAINYLYDLIINKNRENFPEQLEIF